MKKRKIFASSLAAALMIAGGASGCAQADEPLDDDTINSFIVSSSDSEHVGSVYNDEEQKYLTEKQIDEWLKDYRPDEP